MLGNRSSPDELEFDDHEPAREGVSLKIIRWISGHILPLVVLAGLNNNFGDPFNRARLGTWSIVPSHSAERAVEYATTGKRTIRHPYTRKKIRFTPPKCHFLVSRDVGAHTEYVCLIS